MSDPPPPPAPPLPPQRYVNRAANALSRLTQPFIGASRPPSSHAGRGGDLHGRHGPPRIPGPVSSQAATFQADTPIAAVDISPQRTHAVLAGRDLLKTIQVSGPACTEQFNLRAKTVAHTTGQNAKSGFAAFRYRDDLAANDVKWSHGSLDSTIATAAPNGKIVLFDVNRDEVQYARLHEHNRQVHKLDFNPHQGYFLLSGSQDGTMRVWDLRAAAGGRSVSTVRSLQRYKANAEGIRDVKWSPGEGVDFACATDAGTVQRWDLRKDSAPVLKVNAHRKACMSIDWHPDGKHLISGGLDKMVQVWDFSSMDRRQNASWSFRAPSNVATVRWRPVGWHASKKGLGLWQSTQVVTSYSELDTRVHIWNLKRPHVAVWEMDRYNTAPTDILWRSEDLLWTVGNEGFFTQTDMHFVPLVEERRASQTFDISPDGDVAFFLRKRPRRHRTIIDAASDPSSASDRGNIKAGSGEKLSGDKSGGSRSTTDDEASGNFLTSSFKRRSTRSWSSKTSKSVGNTPPSESPSTAITKLDEILPKRAHLLAIRPQLNAIGHVPYVFDAKAFKILASRSCFDGEAASKFYSRLRDASLDKQIEAIFHLNGLLARAAHFQRLAQTWKIMSYVVVRELQARGQVRRALRSQKDEKNTESSRSHDERGFKRTVQNPKKLHGEERRDFKDKDSTLSSPNAPSSQRESSSNISTPLARPVPHRKVGDYSSLARFREDDALLLPSAAYSQKIGGMGEEVRTPGRQASTSTTPSKISFSKPHDLKKTEPFNVQRHETIGSPLSSKPVLHLDPPSNRGSSESPESKIFRLDSEDGFPLLSASMDDSDPKYSLPSTFSSDGTSSDTSSRLEIWKSDQTSTRSDSHDSRLEHPEVMGTGTSSSGSEALTSGGGTLSESLRGRGEDLQANTTTLPGLDNNNPSLAPPSPILSALEAVPETAAPFIPADFEPLTKPNPLVTSLSPKPPFDVASVLPDLLRYHTEQLNDVLLPSSLILLLQPLIDLSPLSLAPQQATAILSAYHSQLTSLGLFVPAAHLRTLTYPSPVHRSIWEPALLEPRITTMCATCGQRLNGVDRRRGPDYQSWTCERCPGLLASCPVCWCRRGKGLWAWCQGCGHGGHEQCLGEWWGSPKSEGGCATEGCLHDCVPGVRRKQREDRLTKQRAMARDKNGPGVKRDDWVAGESRAVERVRSGGLWMNSGAGAVERGTSVSNSDGAPPTRTSSTGGQGAKRVKVVTPSEEGKGWRE